MSIRTWSWRDFSKFWRIIYSISWALYKFHEVFRVKMIPRRLFRVHEDLFNSISTWKLNLIEFTEKGVHRSQTLIYTHTLTFFVFILLTTLQSVHSLEFRFLYLEWLNWGHPVYLPVYIFVWMFVINGNAPITRQQQLSKLLWITSCWI